MDSEFPSNIQVNYPTHTRTSDIPYAGRGLFSLGSIAKGGLIFTVPDPALSIVSNKMLDKVCDTCLRVIDKSEVDHLPMESKPRRCFTCNIYWYCNESCKDQAFSHHHGLECERLKEANDYDIRWTIGSKSEHIADQSDICEDSRLLIRWMSLSETGQLSVVEDEGLTHLNSFGFQRNDSSTYRCADKLSSITGMALEAITATATKIQNNWIPIYQPSLDEGWLALDKKGLVSSFSTKIGTCLEAYVAIMNHSCDANAIPILQGSELQIRAAKDIPAGDEIFLNYGVRGTYKEREQGLKGYGFDCTCTLCAKTAKVYYSESERPILAKIEKWNKRRKLGPKSNRDVFEPFLIIEEVQNLDASTAVWPLLRDLYYDIYSHLCVSNNYLLALKTLLRIAFVIEPNTVPCPTPSERVDTMRSLVALFHFICNSHAPAFGDDFWQYLPADMDLCLMCVTFQLRIELYSRLEECIGNESAFAKSQRERLESGEWVEDNYDQDPQHRVCESEENYSCYSAPEQRENLLKALMEYAQAER